MRVCSSEILLYEFLQFWSRFYWCRIIAEYEYTTVRNGIIQVYAYIVHTYCIVLYIVELNCIVQYSNTLCKLTSTRRYTIIYIWVRIHVLYSCSINLSVLISILVQISTSECIGNLDVRTLMAVEVLMRIASSPTR